LTTLSTGERTQATARTGQTLVEQNSGKPSPGLLYNLGIPCPLPIVRRSLVLSKKSLVVFLGIVLGLSGAAYMRGRLAMSQTAAVPEPARPPGTLATATFGNGCFWCTEAVFQQLKGVHSVVSGYSGGSVKNPTYLQVCTGTTGHAEVIQVTYDPALISYDELLEVFWQTHDPTTLNRQGNDVGTQYRSVIFYHSDKQKELAEEYKKKLNASGVFGRSVVTEIVPFTVFYRAEAYHQNYLNENSEQPYCRIIIMPKLEKLKKVFHDKLKTDAHKSVNGPRPDR
jgi:peptide-methionine (S)-S-oxide reductase